MSPNITNGVNVDSTDAKAILDKYEEERSKRLRSDGLGQFIISPETDEYQKFYRDIWVDETAIDPGADSLVDDSYCEILILGAGYGGLTAAARLIQAGVDANDIRLVDAAGGFGGTWWYNRYPGLMCDVESYIYMPLLEELDYMPKHKYSYGPELRKHAENIADHFNLRDKALFQAQILTMDWDDSRKEWVSKIECARKGQEAKRITVRSRYAIIAGGSVKWPKLPRFQGFDKFKGRTFHTARWDYSITGGTEENPELVNLRDKNVAIIGTGATAIQVVPELSKWAKQVYVFQRTPSAVDERGQRETDKEWWDKENKGREGWQRERRANFSAFVSNTETQPDVNLVGDGWTTFPSYAGVAGNEKNPRLPEEIQPYVEMMTALDLPRQEKVRARVDTIVKDKALAEKLKPWYPGWCKRPCFHDEYLQSFNKPNVSLVDTDGRGVDSLTENGVDVDGQEYPVDVLIFSTGYEVAVGKSLAQRLGMEMRGQGGMTLEEKFANGLATLHGIHTNGFPNLFWLGLSQAGATPNQTAMVDELSRHIAFIVSKATQKYGSKALTIEPTVEAQTTWTEQIVSGATVFATMGICPPSYFNGEGDLFRTAAKGPEAQRKLATGSFWPRGLNDFTKVVEDWRANQPLEGLSISVVQQA